MDADPAGARMSYWLRCRDCGWIWDDDNADHEVCACFDTLGRRLSEEVVVWPTYGLDGKVNGATNVPPYMTVGAA